MTFASPSGAYRTKSDPAKNDQRPNERFAAREAGHGYTNALCGKRKRRSDLRSTKWPKQRGICLRASEAELAAEAGNAESIDPRVGADRRPAPVTDLMIAKVRPLPEWAFAIMKPPSKGGDAPDEGATAAGYGDTGELAAMSAPFCVFAHPSRFSLLGDRDVLQTRWRDRPPKFSDSRSLWPCWGFHRGGLFR